jgi:hypothetical protein
LRQTQSAHLWMGETGCHKGCASKPAPSARRTTMAPTWLDARSSLPQRRSLLRLQRCCVLDKCRTAAFEGLQTDASATQSAMQQPAHAADECSVKACTPGPVHAHTNTHKHREMATRHTALAHACSLRPWQRLVDAQENAGGCAPRCACCASRTTLQKRLSDPARCDHRVFRRLEPGLATQWWARMG